MTADEIRLECLKLAATGDGGVLTNALADLGYVRPYASQQCRPDIAAF